MEPYIQAALDLGYEVKQSFQDDSGVWTYFVSGFGVTLYIREDDQASWNALTNTTAHDDRVTQSSPGYEPPGLPAPKPTDPADNTVADQTAAPIITQNLESISATRALVQQAYTDLLNQAKAAIPYYENYTKVPDEATAWTNFQALPQATKDRLLYNCCRSLAALMRYLVGDLS